MRSLRKNSNFSDKCRRVFNWKFFDVVVLACGFNHKMTLENQFISVGGVTVGRLTGSGGK